MHETRSIRTPQTSSNPVVGPGGHHVINSHNACLVFVSQDKSRYLSQAPVALVPLPPPGSLQCLVDTPGRLDPLPWVGCSC